VVTLAGVPPGFFSLVIVIVIDKYFVIVFT